MGIGWIDHRDGDRHKRRPVADAAHRLELRRGRGAGDERNIDQMALTPRQTRSRTDDHGVSCRVQIDHVEGGSGGNAKASALANGEASQAVVVAQMMPRFIKDWPGTKCVRAQGGEQVMISTCSNEAKILALVVVGRGQVDRARDPANLGLAGDLAEGHEQAAHMALTQAIQGIALIMVTARAWYRRAIPFPAYTTRA